ncbi:hypothetical protein ABZ570_07910 [Micromonospora sp. NPDC007271]|uniref:hypothetical protein n=1 Tax=Micromonospora sp. NPDC007271 TaxID=3154587 RepID=UPI0034022594
MTTDSIVLIDIDQQTWGTHLDRARHWLTLTEASQSAFCALLDSAIGEIGEPHIRRYLTDMRAQAQRHHDCIPDLLAAFGGPGGQRPGGTTMGRVTAAGRALAGAAQGLVGGARGRGYRKLRELLLANQDAIGAFAVTEQLALAVGLRDAIAITFPLIREKTTDQLLLQEYLLEMAPKAILYHADL